MRVLSALFGLATLLSALGAIWIAEYRWQLLVTAVVLGITAIGVASTAANNGTAGNAQPEREK